MVMTYNSKPPGILMGFSEGFLRMLPDNLGHTKELATSLQKEFYDLPHYRAGKALGYAYVAVAYSTLALALGDIAARAVGVR